MTSRAVVVVPLYRPSMSEAERFAFLHNMEVLAQHDIYLACPELLLDYVSQLETELGLEFQVEYFPDRCFSSIVEYNKLLLSADFYRRFDAYEFMLIAQPDALALSDRLEEWCDKNHSYVGAPWLAGLTRPRMPYSFVGVGNGGFSLRKVGDCLAVLESPDFRFSAGGNVVLTAREKLSLSGFLIHCVTLSFALPPVKLKINEDLFWGVVVPTRVQSFSVPEPEQAVDFAFETAPEHLYELNGHSLPFGCHAWERYGREFWRDVLKPVGIELP